jgi:hypothetical protein
MKRVIHIDNFQSVSLLQLNGNVKVIRNDPSLPFVFLFDENHDNENECIDKNIENAKELISNTNIEIIGVESLAGGRDWNEDTREYVTDDSNEKYYREVTLKKWKSNCTRFADELSNIYPSLVFGVESVGMMNSIEDPNDRIMHQKRSKHFIITLFGIYHDQKLNGNLILNSGSNHNDDIETWILNGEIDAIAGTRSNYVRIDTINHNYERI